MMRMFGLGAEPPKQPATQRPPGPTAASTGRPQQQPAPAHLQPGHGAAQPQQPKRDEPPRGGGGGGFFNLPPPGAASSAAPPGAGADLFGALQMKPADAAAAAPAPFSLLDAGSNAAPGASGFNFMQPAAPPPGSTSFSFLATPPTDAPPLGDSSSAPPLGSTGFSFLAQSAPAPSALPPAADLAGASGGRRPSAGAAAPPLTGGALVAAGGAVPVVVQPAVVKKRKTGFRVGVAREESAAGGGGVLSGLVVHASGDDAGGDGGQDDENPHSASAAPQPPAATVPPSALSGVGGGSMLAGLQIHGATLTEPSGSSPSAAASVSSIGGGGGILSGLQVHGAAATAEAPAAPVPASGVVPEVDGDGGVFAGLMTKVSAGSGGATRGAGTDPGSAAGRPGAPVASPPPRALSPTSRKRAVIADLEGAARKLRMRLAEIKQKLRASVEADKKAAAELSAARDLLAQREAEQDDAIRHERFEAAEALNAAIEETRAKVARFERQRRQIAAERAALEADQEAAFADSLAASSDAVMGLKRYSDDREHVLHVFGREALTRLTTASDRIANDEEQLRLKEEHVRLETKLVDEETQQVHRAITDQTDELNAQVTEMRQRHTQLVQDVAELERQLEAKRKEERMASSQLADAEARIKSIHAKFDKQTKRLQAKRAAVDTEQGECSAEADAITHAKFERDKTRTADAISEQAYKRQIEHTRAELGIAEALRAALVEQADRRRKWTATAASVAKKVAQLSEGLESGVKALRQVQSKRAGLEAQTRGIRDRVSVIDSKVPQLNEEKRLAVNERKFKEAGRLTSELKRLSDDREAADKELSVVLSAIDECDAEVASQEADLTAAREAMAAFERTADLARMEALRGAIRVMRRQTRALSRRVVRGTTRGTAEDIDPLTGSAKPEEAAAFALHVPANPELGIDIESDGRTSGQAAALELLLCERELLAEELAQVCARWGHELDIGDETPEETEHDKEGGASGSSATAAAVLSPAPSTAAARTSLAPVAASPESEGAPEALPAADEAAGAEEDHGHAAEVTAPALDLLLGAAGSPAAPTAPWALLSVLLPVAAAPSDALDSDVPTVSAFGFLSSPVAPGTVAGGDGAGFEGAGGLLAGLNIAAAAAVAAAPESEGSGSAGGDAGLPQPTEVELAAERAARLAELAAALQAADSAIAEKQAVIDASVAQEDFDTADAAQVDMDSLAEHRAGILQSAAALGVDDEAALLALLLPSPEA